MKPELRFTTCVWLGAMIIVPPPVPNPSPSVTPSVFRVSIGLVQVDAVVTDKDGHNVSDLTAEDFEIRENGRRREIVSFTYVSRPAVDPSTDQAGPGPSLRTTVPVPSHGAPRSLAIVVDDLTISMEDLASVKRALLRFIDEQMETGDQATFLLSGSGVGALQRFTSDRRLLREAVMRMRFDPWKRARYDAIAARVDADDVRRQQLRSTGTLGALDFLLRGLADIPGRKALVLISSRLPVTTSAGLLEIPDTDRLAAIGRVIERANRGSVVIYGVNARGLDPHSPTADVNTPSLAGNSLDGVSLPLVARRRESRGALQGLQRLADDTGGAFFSDLGEGIAQALADQQGYYLLGYVPDAKAFSTDGGRPHFRELKLRVTRRGVHVRSRAGYLGVADAEASSALRPGADPLSAALLSSFSSGGVHLRLTALFAHDPAMGSYVRSLVHVDSHDLTFARSEDGGDEAGVEVLAVTFRAEGQVVDEKRHRYTIRSQSGKVEADAGLVYFVDLPVKEPGAYQLRVAVRDVGSDRVGTASQFVEVPELADGQLALSGIQLSPRGQGDGAQPSVGANALRRVSGGARLDYSAEVFNVRQAPAALTGQVKVFREEQEMYTGAVRTLEAAGGTDAGRFFAEGRLEFASALGPGPYLLELTVRDTLPGRPPRIARQWVDFEVAP